MRIPHFDESEEPNENYFGPRKKKLDVVRKIDEAIKLALEELRTFPERRAAFLRLLACVRAQTDLLKPTPGKGSVGWGAPVFLVNRLKNLASRQAHWRQPIETWRAKGGTLRLEFRLLAQHLFAVYRVPGFMDSVWDLPAGADAFRQQAWFIRLGRGAMLRSLNLPTALTRHMEHHARRAPEHFTVMQAVRYGETRGLGGSHDLACEVANSRFGRDETNPLFWRTVLRFLVAQTAMPIRHVGPIVEFVQANKFAGEQVLTTDGIQTRAAPCPGFAMEGRTLKSVLRLVRLWNPDLQNISKGFSWERSGLAAYRYVEKRAGEPDFDWSIVELLNSSALHAEGRAMQHCVFSYAYLCRWRESSIWSLRLHIDGEEKRKATIEIDPQRRTIVQICAHRNRRPTARASRIIREWARSAGLAIDTTTVQPR